MDTSNMIINVIAIFSSLIIYVGITNTKWGKAHSQYQYAIMLGAIMFAVLFGGLIRWINQAM